MVARLRFHRLRSMRRQEEHNGNGFEALDLLDRENHGEKKAWSNPYPKAVTRTVSGKLGQRVLNHLSGSYFASKLCSFLKSTNLQMLLANRIVLRPHRVDKHPKTHHDYNYNLFWWSMDAGHVSKSFEGKSLWLQSLQAFAPKDHPLLLQHCADASVLDTSALDTRTRVGPWEALMVEMAHYQPLYRSCNLSFGEMVPQEVHGRARTP